MAQVTPLWSCPHIEDDNDSDGAQLRLKLMTGRTVGASLFEEVGSRQGNGVRQRNGLPRGAWPVRATLKASSTYGIQLTSKRHRRMATRHDSGDNHQRMRKKCVLEVAFSRA